MMAVGGQLRRGMMRRRHVDHVFHERAAITRLAVPVIREEITVGERLRQIVPPEHREPVTHPVHALKQHPAAGARASERLAQRLDFRLRHPLARLEIGLNDAVPAARRETVPTGLERGNDVRRLAVCLDAEAVRVFVCMLGDVGVGGGDRIERPDGVRDAVPREMVR